MRKAGVLSILFVVVLLAFAVVAEAQQLKKVPRIGYLSAFDPAFESARAEAIRLALHERGYIEGQNIGIEYRYAEGKIDRFPELAAKLVHLKVDLIVVAGGDRLVRTAKNATKTIPIVMLGLGSDPIKAGLVESLEKQIVDFALKSRLPSVYSYRAGVDAGGFMYYGADLADSYRRVAYYVDRI
jgi:putative ABC transport system substrate-binding protein